MRKIDKDVFTSENNNFLRKIKKVYTKINPKRRYIEKERLREVGNKFVFLTNRNLEREYNV